MTTIVNAVNYKHISHWLMGIKRMATTPTEYLIGAYLQLIKECDIVSYNVRPLKNNHNKQEELDVIGLNFGSNIAYLCEDSAHLDGLNYGTSVNHSIEQVKKKYECQKRYAKNILSDKCQYIVDRNQCQDIVDSLSGLRL